MLSLNLQRRFERIFAEELFLFVRYHHLLERYHTVCHVLISSVTPYLIFKSTLPMLFTYVIDGDYDNNSTEYMTQHYCGNVKPLARPNRTEMASGASGLSVSLEVACGFVAEHYSQFGFVLQPLLFSS